MDKTPLDQAYVAMTDAPDDDILRLRFYERVADAELFLLLEAEPTSDDVTPILLEDQHVIAFDRAARLASFVGDAAPYVALSGRAIAGMLEGQPLGLALNPGVAPCDCVLTPQTLDWLRATLSNEATQVAAKIERVSPPAGLPERLIEALDAKLATATGMAAGAFLVAVDYAAGGRGHLLAFVGALSRAEPALVRAASEALTFSGIEAGAMDVGFFDPSDPNVARFAKVGLRFDLPQPEGLQNTPRLPPGSDPNAPPILK